ncbi:MAG: hypothetical protein DWH97_10660 [Planctomycetota bacterium]|nr:MAG: hypothetical protein DWH97_10660 [Planctomycetota bacterium]RLS94324.1 MAG: hypothetical protein DWI12_06875 [Planctomycetota bacterium]
MLHGIGLCHKSRSDRRGDDPDAVSVMPYLLWLNVCRDHASDEALLQVRRLRELQPRGKGAKARYQAKRSAAFS